MPTPEQFNAAWEREKQGILDFKKLKKPELIEILAMSDQCKK